MNIYDEAELVLPLLSAEERVERPPEFPRDPVAAGNPGLYSWWGDSTARAVLGTELDIVLPPLLYVGQAGATRMPSGTKSNATLGSRIGQQHIRGNARSSTFRLTISAILLRPLGLEIATGGRLTPESNRVVSAWIADHLRVAIAPCRDRDMLGAVEHLVVRRLNPPLNLDHCDPTPVRSRLSALRAAIPRR